MSGPDTCPETPRLRRLLEGAASPQEQADLDAHLRQCARCQVLLEGLAAREDSWPDLSDVLGGEPGLGRTQPALPHLLARLRGEAAVAPPAPVGADDLTFLDPPSRPGSLGRLGDYEILGVVGRGGMGVVLRAFDEVLQRVVAVKVMSPTLASDRDARQRFVREAQAAAAVTHDHVITIHAVHKGAVPYLVMQFVDGLSLEEKILQTGPLPVEEILRIGTQAAAGLAAAHAQGLIHRDVKPANILLENGVQRVKITDFGLARTAADAGLTQTGVISGTPLYMAPEQARGEPLDHRADLFSLGSVLYVMCTGQAPFRAGSSFEVLRRVCDAPPQPIRELNPAIPAELAEVVARLHRKDPAGRYPSATAVAEVLGKMLARRQQGECGPTALSEPPEPRRRKRPMARRRAWALGLLAAGLLAAGAAFALRPGEAGPDGRKDTPPAPPAAGTGLPPAPVVCTGHKGAVLEVVFSPDGLTVASAGEDRTVRLWDARTGGAKHELRGHDRPVRGLAFSPDGKTLASACEAGEVRLWEVATGRQTDVLRGHTAGLFAVAFAPDGRTLASAGWDRTIRLWEPATRRERILEEDEGVHFIRRLAFAPDGRTLVSAGFQITSWDVKSGARLRSRGFANTSALAYSPDGRSLAAASWKAGAVALLDPAGGEPVALWQAADSDLEGLAYSPDGGLLVSVGGDGLVRAWDPARRRLRTLWPAHAGCISGAAFSPDGKALATAGAGDSQVKVWDVSRLGESPEAPRAEPLVPVPLRHTLAGHAASCWYVAFSPDGGSVASASDDKTVRLWDVRTGKPGHVLRGAAHGIGTVAFSRDGTSLVSAGGDRDNGELLLWDVKGGRQAGALSGHTRGVTDVAFSPDGKLLASGGWDRAVRVHDVASRKEVRTLEGRQPGFVRRVAFSSDGRAVLSAGDVLTSDELGGGAAWPPVPQAETSDLKVSPQGGLLAAAGWKTGKVTLFDLGSGKPRFAWQAHRDNLNSVAFSPDGRLLASASQDGSAKVWDVATQKLRAVLLGHRGPVYGVAFSPDGKTLATSGSRDCQVLLWDVSALGVTRK